MSKRFDRLDVATSDLADTIRVYQHNFGLVSVREGDEATIAIGDAQIRLRAGASVSETIASTGEGLAGVWLEADDLEAAAEALRKAGAVLEPIRIEHRRRILAVDPKSANMVPLYLFDRKV